MAFGLKVAGTLVPLDANDLVLARVRLYEYRGCPRLELVRRGGPLPGLPDPYLGKTCALSSGSTVYFTGDFVSVVPGFQPEILGWGIRYTALGLRNRGDWVPFTDEQTGTDTSPFNVQLDNQATDYLASRAGRTVGQILTAVLTMTQNANALDSLGIGNYTSLSPPTLPAATVTDLSTLTLIPPASVYVMGQTLLNAIEGFCETWAPNTFFYVDPLGNLRFIDMRNLTQATLTMGTDPIEPVALSRDVSGCYQQCEVRGQPYVVPKLATTATGNGLLAELFAHDGLTNSQAKTVWKPSDFVQPAQPGTSSQATASAAVGAGSVTALLITNGGYGYDPANPPAISFSGGGGSGAAATATVSGAGVVTGYTGLAGGTGYTSPPDVTIAPPSGGSQDVGTCTCPSTTQVTVTSDNPLTSWPADYWDQTGTGRKGWVYLIDPVTAGINQAWSSPIVANTALTPGGTSTLTLGVPLPITSYTSYVIYGTAGGACNVWRLYEVTDTDTGEAMANMFQSDVPFVLASGDAATMTSYPMGSVLWSATGGPPYQEVSCAITCDPTSNPPTVLFSQPTYLVAGGHVPVEVRALLAINSGVNQVFAPSSSTYEGTSNTVEELTRTLVVTVLEWRDPINTSAMQVYAQDVLDSVKDAVMEGEVVYYGLYTDALTPGLCINIAGSDNGAVYTTGWEDNGAGPGGTNYVSSFTNCLGLPIVACDLEFVTDGSPLLYRTIMHLSNRRASYGAGAFLRPSRVGLDVGSGLDLADTPYGAEGPHSEGERSRGPGEFGAHEDGPNGEPGNAGALGEGAPVNPFLAALSQLGVPDFMLGLDVGPAPSRETPFPNARIRPAPVPKAEPPPSSSPFKVDPALVGHEFDAMPGISPKMSEAIQQEIDRPTNVQVDPRDIPGG